MTPRRNTEAMLHQLGLHLVRTDGAACRPRELSDEWLDRYSRAADLAVESREGQPGHAAAFDLLCSIALRIAVAEGRAAAQELTFVRLCDLWQSMRDYRLALKRELALRRAPGRDRRSIRAACVAAADAAQ